MFSFAYLIVKIHLQFHTWTLNLINPLHPPNVYVSRQVLLVCNLLTVLRLSCFAGGLLKSDDHVNHTGVGEVDEWS